jgi:hypothetical protein
VALEQYTKRLMEALAQVYRGRGACLRRSTR